MSLAAFFCYRGRGLLRLGVYEVSLGRKPASVRGPAMVFS